MWPFTREKKREPEYNQFIEQIKQIHKLETDYNDLYRFCQDACDEIYKYTGNYDWHEKLKQILIN